MYLAIRDHFFLPYFAHSLKPCRKRKKNILISEGSSPHSIKLQMSEEGTYYNQKKAKSKNNGKRESTLFWDWKKKGGWSRHREQHCHQVVTVPQVTLWHLTKPAVSLRVPIRMLWEGLKRKKSSSAGPSPPSWHSDSRGAGAARPYYKSPHVTDTQWTLRTGDQNKGSYRCHCDAYRLQWSPTCSYSA